MNLQVGVKALIENSQNNYLFLHRSKVIDGHETSIWDIPGGRIEPEEDLMSALAREILEETGIVLTAAPALIAAQDIFAGTKLHVVRLTYLVDGDGEAILSDEHTDAKWLSLEDAMQLNLDPYIKELIENKITPA
jgi:8-oxo-dGTP diphosphatase